MKLIAVFAVSEFENKLKSIFIEQKVAIFSEVEMKGFRLPDENSRRGWFGGSDIPTFSVSYFAFVPEEQAQGMLTAIQKFNEAHPGSNPMHAFQLNVEASV